MKFKNLVDMETNKKNSKFKIVINERQLKYIIDQLIEEQIENKIIEHKSLNSKSNELQ